MHDVLQTLFGTGKDLNGLQMGCRAFVMFFVTLALIRLAGMRAFGQKSAFDAIIVIMLGAVLSRAVAGASPFFPTIIAGIVICILHRLLALLSIYSDLFGAIFKGEKTLLYKNNKMMEKNMMGCGLSKKDLEEEVRLLLNENNMNNVEEIFMERSGKISILKKPSSQ